MDIVDLEGLPPEVIKNLVINNERIVFENSKRQRVLKILRSKNGPFTANEIIIAFYKNFGISIDRSTVILSLSQFTKEGKIQRISRGVYKVKDGTNE